MRKIYLIAVGLIGFLIISGCESNSNKEAGEMNKQAWEACLKSGGIPLGAWFNSAVLSDCKYKHD